MNENEKNTVVEENSIQEPEVVETPAAESTVTENTTPVEDETLAEENSVPAAEPTEDGDNSHVEENTAAVEEPANAQEFSLTTEQLMGEIRTALEAYKIPSDWDPDYMITRYWMNDVQGDEVIVMDCSTYKLMGIPFSMNGDNVVLDMENMKRKKVTFEDWDEGEVLSGVTAAFTELNTKIVELSKEFQTATNEINEMKPKLEAYQQAEAEAVAAAEKAKRDELFSIMDEKLGANAEYTALKENTEITYAELETKCYALVGRQSAEFSYVPTTNNKGTVRFGVGGTQNGSDAAYGGLMEHYLGK